MGTHYNGSKKEMRALDAYIKLMRAADTINSTVNLSLSKFGLTEVSGKLTVPTSQSNRATHF